MTVSASEKAYTIIKESILSGEFEPGTPLAEVELVKLTKLSRSPVREALKILTSEGLVNTIPGRGTFTLKLEERDINEIFQLRLIFETEALKLSYRFIPKVELVQLKEKFEKVNEKDTTVSEFYSLDNELHNLFIDYCGNRRLQGYYYNLKDQIQLIHRISSLSPDHFSVSTNYHLQIVNHLLENEIDQCIDVLKEHIKQVLDSTIEVYQHSYYYAR